VEEALAKWDAAVLEITPDYLKTITVKNWK
jgi:hypothetical protein